MRRACLRQGGILHSGAISILLFVTLMTSMQTLTQLPNYASARITPTPVVGSIQSEGMSILPTSISPTHAGQPIVPASGDSINEAAQNTTGPIQNTSLSSVTQQATIDPALAGQQQPAVPVPARAINDETINNDDTDGSDDGSDNGDDNGDHNGDNHDDNGDHNGDNHDDNGDHNGDNHDDNGDHNGDNHDDGNGGNGNDRDTSGS